MGIDLGNFSDEVPGWRQTSNNILFNTTLICSSSDFKVAILSFKVKLQVSVWENFYDSNSTWTEILIKRTYITPASIPLVSKKLRQKEST
jgi:hypothetical protein